MVSPLLPQSDPRRPAGQVVGHDLDDQPGGVGGEVPRERMVEAHAVLQVADGVLHLSVAAMIGSQFQGAARSIGDEAVVAVGMEEG